MRPSPGQEKALGQSAKRLAIFARKGASSCQGLVLVRASSCQGLPPARGIPSVRWLSWPFGCAGQLNTY
eukprot:12743537-Heterocapsa_arctica.AAC.1